jgi:hypothetical protein
MSTRSRNFEPLYSKDDLVSCKTRSDNGKPRQRSSMAAGSSQQELESIRYSEADPTAGGAENIKSGTLGRLK